MREVNKGLRRVAFISPQRTQRAQSFIEDFLCLPRWGVFKLCVTLCPLWCILFSACERRELTYYLESEITLTANWSKANLDHESAYGATAIFYPQDGRAPQVVLMGDRTQTTVRLVKGYYDIVLFNRSFNDFSSVAFRGQDKFETLEAYTRKTDTRSGTDVIVSPPKNWRPP